MGDKRGTRGKKDGKCWDGDNEGVGVNGLVVIYFYTGIAIIRALE